MRTNYNNNNQWYWRRDSFGPCLPFALCGAAADFEGISLQLRLSVSAAVYKQTLRMCFIAQSWNEHAYISMFVCVHMLLPHLRHFYIYTRKRRQCDRNSKNRVRQCQFMQHQLLPKQLAHNIKRLWQPDDANDNDDAGGAKKCCWLKSAVHRWYLLYTHIHTAKLVFTLSLILFCAFIVYFFSPFH